MRVFKWRNIPVDMRIYVRYNTYTVSERIFVFNDLLKGNLVMSKPQEVTLKELVMVKDSIIYPVILDVLEQDIGKMKLIDLKIRMIYINNLVKVCLLLRLDFPSGGVL
ncbi:MAG: hypothetical protein JWM44_2479 [Bacilli bacterium]|nr:hypothetical protein [Bacilli bacterium]